jgi:dihydrofolate reductase
LGAAGNVVGSNEAPLHHDGPRPFAPGFFGCLLLPPGGRDPSQPLSTREPDVAPARSQPRGHRVWPDVLGGHDVHRAGVYPHEPVLIGSLTHGPHPAPVFVLTNRAREPWVRHGGTTFTFVTDGIESALEQARAAAGEKDVQISGGADIVRQFIEAGLLDELQIHLAPGLLGDGVRLFDRIDTADAVELEVTRVIDSPRVTHLRYRVVK